MDLNDIRGWQHSHTFDQDRKRPGETRTLIVIAITGVMMGVEIATGLLFGSMALLADGLHMGSHAAALSVNALAYRYARRRARDDRFSFGTGKVNALGGYSGAVLLAVFAALMAWESVRRLLAPVPISFDQAILVAFIGLVVNGASVLILGVRRAGHAGRQGHDDDHGAHHHDHNLTSAYLHVMADALTSVLAIIALFAAKYLGAVWMDPVMGLVGAVLVTRWSIGLLRASGAVLLDHQGPAEVRRTIRESMESDGGCIVSDLHLWSIGPGLYAAIIAVVASDPRSPDHYRSRLPSGLGLAHVTIEVQVRARRETPEG